MPGTCAGLVLGQACQGTIAEIWQRLNADYTNRPVVGTLVRGGPVALAKLAGEYGFVPGPGYAGKCHLCWEVRSFLATDPRARGRLGDELEPAWLYGR